MDKDIKQFFFIENKHIPVNRKLKDGGGGSMPQAP